MTKFHAKRTTVDGVTFSSKGEADRYRVLKIMQMAGAITDLELQPKYPIVWNGTKICTYIADFRYKENGIEVVEDFKGFKTPAYRLKKKMVKATYGFDILETKG